MILNRTSRSERLCAVLTELLSEDEKLAAMVQASRSMEGHKQRAILPIWCWNWLDGDKGDTIDETA